MKRKHHVTTNPPTLISVQNHSTRVADADVEKMVAAVATQLARDYAPFYGPSAALEFVPKGGKPNPDGVPFVIADHSDVPDAAGYHDETDADLPRGFVFVSPTLDNGGTVLSGANSVSVTLSHEALEAEGDLSANIWADGPDGNDYAYELADAFEADSYEIDGVSVSNFALPSFFDPHATGRVDFMSLGKAPFVTRPGGYQIKRTEPGAISQVFGRTMVGVGPHRRRAIVVVDFDPGYAHWKKASKITNARRRRTGGQILSRS